MSYLCQILIHLQGLPEHRYHTGYVWHFDRKDSINGLMESLLSDYTGDIEYFRKSGIRDRSCLFLLQLRFLILNKKQLGVIAKTNSWDSRDPVSNLVLVSCDSISIELFPHSLNGMIELDISGSSACIHKTLHIISRSS